MLVVAQRFDPGDERVPVEGVQGDCERAHGLVGVVEAPIDLSYLSDAVLLLRFFEARGTVRKAISVMKKRIGAHEDTIRELRLSSKGLQVGEPLADFQGIMSGIPTYIGSQPMIKTPDADSHG